MNNLNELYCLQLQRKTFLPDNAPSKGGYFCIKAIFNILGRPRPEKVDKNSNFDQLFPCPAYPKVVKRI